MPRYTIKLNVVMMGMDTITIDDPNDYQVGQTVSLSPTSNITVQGPTGSVSLGPGVTISGTVVSKE